LLPCECPLLGVKRDYGAIAVLIALMVWAAAEKLPRDKLRLSARGGIASFFALAIVGLFYVKWSPYYAQRRSSLHTIARSVRQ